jgi:FlaG/FlaF family flagellin (archaellin)
MRTLLTQLIGFVVLLRAPDRDERGLSQSTENAILLAGAVVIAGVVITVITGFVTGRLSALGGP